jgi:hypothetical protein
LSEQLKTEKKRKNEERFTIENRAHLQVELKPPSEEYDVVLRKNCGDH